jgi:Undecaprenyl-phosphate glucose phosphotransferase
VLKKHSQFFETLLLLFDLVVISASWVFSYYLRFTIQPVPVTKGIPDFRYYAALLPAIWVIWAVAFKAFGLYRPRRIASRLSEVVDVAKACSLSTLILIAGTFLVRQFEYSRLVLLFFWATAIAATSLSRAAFREALRFFRRRGYNLRYVLVVGAGALAHTLIERLRAHPELGLRVVGLLAAEPDLTGSMAQGLPILGTYGEAGRIVRERGVDQVIIALPLEASGRLEEILKGIGDEMVDIRVVPDLVQFATLRGGVEEFEGLPIIGLQDSPLYGWNLLAKRAVDLALSAGALVLLAPLMLAIALGIRLTSRGPVLYRQERMGLDGRVFGMLKFRSMRRDAEAETGAVWARPEDPRRTRLGVWLRRTGLDELPQLLNVLRGEMSLVGPRPERPVFIEAFRRTVPRYMLRHKMKAGITGWAQVNGWRGNTSVEERIAHDLYYIEHWSLTFDLRILLMTCWRGLFHRNAY